jgi:hypothetical protein
MSFPMTWHFTRRALITTGFALAASPGLAQFGRVTQARLRLIKGGIEADGTRVAGIHITLQPGWKTYWRHPGDSGIPPGFDWTRSENLKSAEVSFPAPERVRDGAGEILVYRREVVLPVRAVPIDPARPIVLRLDMALGLCEQICIPAELQGEIVHDGRSTPADVATILQSLVRVPRTVPAGTAVTQWRTTGGGPARTIDFATTLPLGVLHAVVEGPEAWQIPLPVRVATLGDGADHWRIERLRLGPSNDAFGAVRVTVFGRSGSVEELRRLDG